jgi:MinD superfamily P-loop ATPase
MIISVASGKGGTGKTTVSTNLAVSLDRPLKLLDCDVEEPNVHLFLKPESMVSHVVSTFIPSIDEKTCTGCGKCAEICQFNALAVIGEKVLVFAELCHSCEGCLAVCPEAAVGRGARELGVIETGICGEIVFSHGRLRVGEAMSPPLIDRVRAQVQPDELVIIDAPPGTSCPAISAMKHSDFVLLVTEPTPFGLHDLILTVEAVKQLGLPCGLVINRSDIGDDKVQRYARREGVPILMEIPFDRTIAERYSRGLIMAEHDAQWRARFVDLFDKISALVSAETSAHPATDEVVI